MSAIVKKCIVCLYDYSDMLEHRPLMLPCGHTFCRLCLEKLKTQGTDKCPTCRQQWKTQKLEQLPVCYQLLPEENINASSVCSQHQNLPLLIWCQDCRVTGCKLCLSSSHRMCDWLLIEDAAETLKRNCKDIVKETTNTITQRLDSLRGVIHEATCKLHTVNNLLQRLKTFRIKLEEYINCLSIQEMETIGDLSIVQTIGEDSEYSTLLVLQTKINQVKDIETNHILPQEPDYNGLKKIVISHQSSLEQLQGPHWDIRNCHTAEAAIKLLKHGNKPTEMPSLITLTVTKDWGQSPFIIELLPLMASVKCDIRLRFLDTFLDRSKESMSTDHLRMSAFKSTKCWCLLKEYWGNPSKTTTKTLPYGALEVKGVAALADTDVNELSAVEWWSLCYNSPVMRQLHLNLPKHWPGDVAPHLFTKTFQDYVVNFHFAGVHDHDLDNLKNLIEKLTKKEDQKSNRCLFLPESRLTESCITNELLTMVCRGTVQVHPGFAQVYIDTCFVVTDSMETIQKQYQMRGIKLEWTHDNSL